MSTPISTDCHRPLPLRLLGVWAHPDDEAYLSAGLMARTIDAGGTVTCVTATSGEMGTDDPDRQGRAEFARFREGELRESLARLGVTDLRLLHHPDGGCEAADAEAAVRSLVEIVTSTRPDVIVTFGPDGITGHPDHRAVSRWTTEAWRRTGEADLLYATMTHDFLARHRTMHEDLGLFGGYGLLEPFGVRHDELALAAVLDDAEVARKRRALAAHASQTEPLAALIGEPAYTYWYQEESFRRPTAFERLFCALAVPGELVGVGGRP
jgi:LmbE family N-acetylglucosaminyl deacetylase